MQQSQRTTLLVLVHGLCYLNHWLILSQQNVRDIINQEKRCSKLVTTLVYFPQTAQFQDL